MSFRDPFARIARRARASLGRVPAANEAPPPQAPSSQIPPPQGTSPRPAEILDGATIDAVETGWFNSATGELLAGFPIGPDDIVLDFGCGDAPLLEFVAGIPAELILVDSDAAKLEAAQVRIAPKRPRKVRVLVSGDALPLPDASVTRVVATEVLEHVKDPERELRELVRVARPGAMFLLSVPHARSENAQRPLVAPGYFEWPNHVRVFESEEFRSLVERCGLQIEKSFLSGFYWTIWWCFFWVYHVDLARPAHPLLENWSHTWGLLLKTPDGARVKKVLDECLPKSQVLIARKP